jgi:sec-independent protein translocase protein TatA
MGSIGAPELLIVLVIVLLVFGGTKLPQLARSLGRAQSEFRKGTKEPLEDGDGARTGDDSAPKA